MERTSLFLYIPVVLLLCVDIVQCQTRDNVDSLYRDLLNTSYNARIRPEYNQSTPTVIDFEFHLLSLVIIDEVKGKFSVTAFLSLKWSDPRLAWNPEDYGMAKSIALPRNSVWKPEFMLVNPSSSLSLFGPDSFPVRYTHDGIGIWNVGDLMEAVCEYDVTKFPFDEHTCQLRLLPVGTLAHEIDFNSTQTTVGLASFNESGQWSLTSSNVYFNVRRGQFRMANIDFTIRRRSEFFLTNMFAPILIILHLNAFVFLLPAESGERTSYAMTCILSTAVFMTAVSGQLPATSRPLASLIYFLMNMIILSTVICILNIISLRCYFTNQTKRVPKYLYRLVEVAAWQSIVRKLKKWKCSRSRSCDSQGESSENVIKTNQHEISVANIRVSEEKSSEDVLFVPTWKDVGHFLDSVFFAVAIFLAILSSMTFAICTAS